jgi:phage gpG-like protein
MIGLQGADQLQARLNALKGSPRGILKAWQIGTVAEAKLAVPRKTGTLGRSIRAGTLFSDHAVVEAAVNYAAFVEYGTRPTSSGRATASSCASRPTPARPA